MTGNYSPTGFDFYQPGMHTQDQLQEMLAEFSDHPTEMVLYEPTFTSHLLEAWPNTPPSAVANDVMADYIKREYHFCATLGPEFEGWMRNGLACPGDTGGTQEGGETVSSKKTKTINN